MPGRVPHLFVEGRHDVSMADHLTLDVDRLVALSPVESSSSSLAEKTDSCPEPLYHAISIDVGSEGGRSVTTSPQHAAGVAAPNGIVTDISAPAVLASGEAGGNVVAECRICQEEDEIGNLETPCACSGSVKFAHRKCVQRWCNEKGDTVCEICHQPYQSGYTAPPRPPHTDSMPIELSGEWGITGSHQLEFRDPRILAMAAAERHFLEAEYDEYASANASGAACCRSAALILMALLLLRHALYMAAAGADEDPSTFLTLFVLRAAGFLLPCYIMARAMNILQRRRQRQEAMAAAEMAILLQGAQARGTLRFSVAPGTSPAHELP